MAMIAYGNRLLWMGRSSSAITMSSALGSPALFNNAVVSEGASIPQRGSTGGVGAQSVGYLHTTGLPRAWFHWDHAVEGGTGPGSFQTILEIIGVGGQVLADLYIQSGTDFRFRVWNGGTLSVKSSTIPLISSGLTTYDIDYVAGVNGSVTAYRGGLLWFSLSWSDATAIQILGVRLYNIANTNNRTVFSQFAMSDGDDLRGFLVRSTAINGTGNYNDGTGAPADTGDVNITTAKSLSAADARWTGTKPSLSLPAGTTVEQAAVNILARAASPVPNARLMIRRGGVDGYSANLSPALAAGYTPRSFPLSADLITGLPWDLADINAAEFGVQALA